MNRNNNIYDTIEDVKSRTKVIEERMNYKEKYLKLNGGAVNHPEIGVQISQMLKVYHLEASLVMWLCVLLASCCQRASQHGFGTFAQMVHVRVASESLLLVRHRGFRLSRAAALS